MATTAFVVVPSVMVFLTLVLPAQVDHIANLVPIGVYASISLEAA